ncbi:MAG: hypothetical protein WBD36_03115 [Bacteroidota bacterium]
MRTLFRCFLASFLLLVTFANPVNLYSCGPYFPSTVFVDDSAPDFSMEQFLEGKIGIARPTFSSIYLFVAYRYFSGNPLSEVEQSVINATDLHDSWMSPWESLSEWMEQRQLVLGDRPATEYPIETNTDNSDRRGYLFYQNINYDAFHTAASTLAQRIVQFGVHSPYIVDWVHAQDAVFFSAESAKVPLPVDSAAPGVIKADRDYQIAAAYFYMREFQIAKSLFGKISRDPNSPWNKLSRFLIARTEIRQATLSESNQDSLLKTAEGKLRVILKDSSMAEFHPSALRLHNFCLFRTNPWLLYSELDQKITRTAIDSLFPIEWRDYATLLRQFQDSSFSNESDFIHWKRCYRGRAGPNAFNEAYNQWRRTKSGAWLIAALSDAGPRTPELPSLIQATTSIPPYAPEYFTANYWAVRLLIAGEKYQEARSLIDVLVDRIGSLSSVSNANLLNNERVRIAGDLSEFLRYCHQQAIGIRWDSEEISSLKGSADLFVSQASVLNRFVSLRVLDSICANSLLPPSLQQSLCRATWVRSFLLGEDKISIEVGKFLARIDPQLKPFLDQYVSSSDFNARRFNGAYLLLKHPGLRPSIRIGVDREVPLNVRDSYRDNWWYSGDLAIEATAADIWAGSPQSSESKVSVWPPSFLTKSDKETAEKETRLLTSAPAAATYLGRIVNSWARTNAQDYRVPEALHLVVQVSRVGCRDDRSTQISKEAFLMLHRQFPKSEWTKQTNYWY